MKTIIFGEYNRNGYTIFRSSRGGLTEVYRAGNHTMDSAQMAPTAATTVPLRMLRTYCIQASRDKAEELHVEYGGVVRTEEES